MPATPRVGTTFAGYRIERVLGRGGMSVVFLAEHPRLKSAVALKLLAPELAEDDVFRERLLRESRLAASISHPNVVPVYDTGEEDGILFISMRFVDGRDLRELLRTGALPLERTTAVCTSSAAALDAAHAGGLVHRDVKPANVLVQEAPWHVYVADFGLTKHADARSGATATGLVGTIDYMAPEQIEGRVVDGRADVYSLGCVAFECLTGRPPFKMENQVAVIWAHMRSTPPAVTDLDRTLPRAFDEVLQRALAKDPEERQPSAGELAAELEAAAATRRRRRAPRPAVAFRLPRARRRTVKAAAAGAVLGAAVATIVATAITSAVSSDRTRTVVTRPRIPTQFAALLRGVPAPMRASCVRAAALSPDFDAALECKGTRGVTVRYSHAVSGARMRAQLASDAVLWGVAARNRPVSPVGRCGSTPASIRDWGGDAPSRRQLTPGEQRPVHGRLLCYVSPFGWAVLEWSDVRFDILSAAFGVSSRSLYRWWTKAGGPIG
jgi:predicted Ser/Thr protein kinase